MPETTYQKTADGLLAVVSTTTATQTFSVADLQTQLASAQQNLTDTRTAQAQEIQAIQSQIDDLNIKLTQAQALGLS